MNRQLDSIDIKILDYLQTDARMSNSELARRVELSPAGLKKRLQKLEEWGVIKQYRAIVDREAVGIDMLCFVQVTLQRHELSVVSEFKERVQQMDEVLECHHLTGEYDYLLKVLVRNRKHLEQFLLHTLTPVSGMDKLRTSLVLSEIKETTAVPVRLFGSVEIDEC